ncbi:hypothetical protein ALI22I_19900 [Saccharothrix sp. ALI-22-I]|uniref:hypothetical protein n=1 Tax=Saccharothrix sp. ALI-22-I TaxID=1933778 RepID=UPI00097BE706|nr:hypothetical protein [Saccharothrix sp. ALI-22-I]ONI88012.1 hypothetical protein ALI22I_19900 [Saccharothrix sp. ALI-22-I]
MTERPTPLFSPPTPQPPPPLTTIDATPKLDDTELLLSTGIVDHSGRAPARKLLHALDWRPGQATTARLRGHAITIGLDPDSPHRIDTRHQVLIPAGLRDLTGIRIGDTVVLLGAPQRQLLIVYPIRALTALLAEPTDRITGLSGSGP